MRIFQEYKFILLERMVEPKVPLDFYLGSLAEPYVCGDLKKIAIFLFIFDEKYVKECILEDCKRQ